MRFKSILFITCLFLFGYTSANNGFSIKTVVIDAGHGGKDPGASGPGKNHEKDIALAVTLKLGDYITKNCPDVNVIYTRKTDVFLELHERAEIANKAKADLFIAVHINSSPNSEFYGTSSYVLGLHRTEANLDVAKRENAVILLEDDRDKNYEFDPNSPEGHIIMSMKQNAFLDQSIDLASKIESQFENQAKRKSLGVKQAGFYVLYKTAMPSILAEIGFISNPEEEKFLVSAKGQDQLANSLFNAFKIYKQQMEGDEGTKPAVEQQAQNNPVREEVKTEAPVVKKETEAPVVKKEAEPVKATSIPNEDIFVTKDGKRIRKPLENASGGGKATPAKTETVVIQEEPKPAVAESKPQPKAEPKKGEVKPEPVKTEPKKEEKAEVKETKPEPKTEVKAEPVNETKPEPVKTEPKKKEPKKEIKPEPVKETAPAAISGVVFKVQLFAVKNEPKDLDKISKTFPPISTELIASGLTRYYTGNFTSITEAKKRLAAAKASGYPDAYLVGFKNGERLSPSQMQQFQ